MTAFVKMHGLGNDFVIFDARDAALSLTPDQARAVADRHFGIGCDTIVIMRPGDADTDAFVQFINADGSESGACLNATRCVARLLMEERGHTRIKLATKAGLLIGSDAGKGLVTIDAGLPRLDWDQVPLASEVDTTDFPLDMGSGALPVSAVSMGNPHCVIFVTDTEQAPLTTLGPRIETLSFFPQRTNVEFAQIVSRTRIRMRVWERGVGVTLACGTGACATLVACHLLGLSDREARLDRPGGPLWKIGRAHV